MKGALYWPCRERNAAQSDFEVKPRLEALYLSQGRGPLMKLSFSREYVNENSMFGLLNSHFVGLMVRPDS